MRVGVLCRSEVAQIEWAHRLGFRSVGMLKFFESPLAPPNTEWKRVAEQLSARAKDLGIRISAIGALYKNPLDSKQTDYSREMFRRAIEVASHIGVKTVCGFPGAIIELEMNERGGNPVYKSFDNHFPQLLAFWEPLAKFAADKGVRLAFENCPQGAWHLPIMGYNMLAQPAMWEKFFNATKCENIGIEWDASHLMCQFIDPVENIHRFGSKIFHVHAKDAYINRRLMEVYGICHPAVAEHRFCGLGQANWAEIIHALIRAGYDSDLNIEGFHDPVFRDHGAWVPDDLKGYAPTRCAGQKLEESGLMIAKRTLEQFVPETEA